MDLIGQEQTRWGFFIIVDPILCCVLMLLDYPTKFTNDASTHPNNLINLFLLCHFLAFTIHAALLTTLFKSFESKLHILKYELFEICQNCIDRFLWRVVEFDHKNSIYEVYYVIELVLITRCIFVPMRFILIMSNYLTWLIMMVITSTACVSWGGNTFDCRIILGDWVLIAGVFNLLINLHMMIVFEKLLRLDQIFLVILIYSHILIVNN